MQGDTPKQGTGPNADIDPAVITPPDTRTGRSGETPEEVIVGAPTGSSDSPAPGSPYEPPLSTGSNESGGDEGHIGPNIWISNADREAMQNAKGCEFSVGVLALVAIELGGMAIKKFGELTAGIDPWWKRGLARVGIPLGLALGAWVAVDAGLESRGVHAVPSIGEVIIDIKDVLQDDDASEPTLPAADIPVSVQPADSYRLYSERLLEGTIAEGNEDAIICLGEQLKILNGNRPFSELIGGGGELAVLAKIDPIQLDDGRIALWAQRKTDAGPAEIICAV